MTHETNPHVARAKSTRWKLLVGASLCGACALFRAARPESLPDGTYRLSCTSPLNECLASLDTVCRDGYDVIHAGEKRERRGPAPVVSITIASEAVVRCRTPEALFFSGSDHKSEAASDAAIAEDAGMADSSTATTPGAAAEAAPGTDP